MPVPGERAAAKVAGLPRYFTGRPCIHGHVAERETSGANCVVCELNRCRAYDAKNRVERRRRRRDQKRAKYLDDPAAQAERRDQFRAWKKRSGEPKPISLVAYEGTHETAGAHDWVTGQGKRLGVDTLHITNAIRNGWTLIEIEQLPRSDAGQLADFVTEHKPGDGFIPGEFKI